MNKDSSFRSRSQLALVIAVSVILLALTGCNVSLPRWGFPGTLPQQRFNATMSDPYADSDVGPEVVGNRPREFEKPLPEPVRSHIFATPVTR